MEYKVLNQDHKIELLQRRIIELEQQHYHHVISLELLEEEGLTPAVGQQIETIKKQVSSLESVVRRLTNKLEELEKDAEPEPAGQEA